MFFRSNVSQDDVNPELPPDHGGDEATRQDEADRFAAARRQMVEEQLRFRDIVDSRVLEAMGRVPRERFVPAAVRSHAYEDHPLPIGLDQTISQPYIVALMVQIARPKPEDRALEVGVGCGYQAAILCGLCEHVYGIEILDALAAATRQRLAELGYANVTVRCGDGSAGWPEEAPFDVILVSAAPDRVPQPLIDQLAPGGRLLIPVGRYSQQLLLIEKLPDGTCRRIDIAPVQFVPMTGEAGKPTEG
jgi:protein-L-isoaspartate(D-aspartate) O-methyltransferase